MLPCFAAEIAHLQAFVQSAAKPSTWYIPTSYVSIHVVVSLVPRQSPVRRRSFAGLSSGTRPFGTNVESRTVVAGKENPPHVTYSTASGA